MEPPTVEWKGKSGTDYAYHIYTIGAPMDAVPANYVFAQETSPKRLRPIYIGETGDISERFDDHHKMPCIKREGATHITTHKSSSRKGDRTEEEQDLIANYSPPCND